MPSFRVMTSCGDCRRDIAELFDTDDRRERKRFKKVNSDTRTRVWASRFSEVDSFRSGLTVHALLSRCNP
eukprot:2375605-Rhodomonas_salina.7